MTDFGRIALASRLTDRTPTPTFISWLTMALSGGLRRGDEVLSMPVGTYRHVAANRIVDEFLRRSDCDTLCVIDADQVWAPDTLERLRANPANHVFDAVMALIVNRSNGAPVLYRQSEVQPYEADGTPLYDVYMGWTPGETVEVDTVGLGFTLIRRAILEAAGPNPFRFLTPTTGEDVTFSYEARARGARLAVDTSVEVGHLIERSWTFGGVVDAHARRVDLRTGDECAPASDH